MKKIAIFSDIHGNKYALSAILNDINKKKINETIYLGDSIGIGPFPKECIELLEKSNVKYILGNHELYYLNNINKIVSKEEIKHHDWVRLCLNDEIKNYLKKCSIEYSINYNNKTLKFSHFLIEKNDFKSPYYSLKILKGKINDIVKKYDCDYLFFGHEHKSFEISYDEKKFIDVGSSGCVYNDITSYYILELDDDIKYYKVNIKYDRNTFIKSCKNINYPLKDYLLVNFFGIK